MEPTLSHLLSDSDVQGVLELLKGACRCADRVRRPCDCVAIPMVVFERAGLSAALEQLRSAGLVQQSEGGCWLTEAGAGLEGETVEVAANDPMSPRQPLTGRPYWNRTTGQLCVGDTPVRKVPKNATRVIPLLEVFQDDEWPQERRNPFGTDSLAVVQLHDAVRTLNLGQRPRALRFEITREGRGVTWRLEGPACNDSV